MALHYNDPDFLRPYRYVVLVMMLATSLVDAYLRFANDWGHFWTALAMQAFFTQAVFAYFRGGTVSIGSHGLDRNAHPATRAAGAAIAFAFYMALFAIDGPEREDSIYERRPSDWTMPTWEEFRREPGN